MKDQETINAQILIAERELAALDAKRKALQDRIKQLKGLKQSIADEQLPFDRLPEAVRRPYLCVLFSLIPKHSSNKLRHKALIKQSGPYHG